MDDLNIRSYGVGITTLEEVFLKIGHGEIENDEEGKLLHSKLQNESNPNSIAQDLATAELELDEYSITESHETSVFCLHFVALVKKRILM